MTAGQATSSASVAPSGPDRNSLSENDLSDGVGPVEVRVLAARLKYLAVLTEPSDGRVSELAYKSPTTRVMRAGAMLDFGMLGLTPEAGTTLSSSSKRLDAINPKSRLRIRSLPTQARAFSGVFGRPPDVSKLTSEVI
jgi:hypothetical protein